MGLFNFRNKSTVGVKSDLVNQKLARDDKRVSSCDSNLPQLRRTIATPPRLNHKNKLFQREL